MGNLLKLHTFLLLTALSLILAQPVMASDPTPSSPDGFSIISAPMVKHMLDTNTGMVINVLSDLEFDMQHITGSINIPITSLETTDQLPKDKNTMLVFYCMGKR